VTVEPNGFKQKGGIGMSKLAYHVKFDENCEAEGRVFYKDESYPVYEEERGSMLLCAENGEFRFTKPLMAKLIKEWNLEVVEK